jgi:hypothetical protein
MRLATILLLTVTLPLSGCFTQTDIVRTVTRPDGTTERYENRSTGYNYNPNFTGHWDQWNHSNSNSSVSLPPPPPAQPGAFGQYTIR